MGQDYFGGSPIAAGMTFARGVLLIDDMEGTLGWQSLYNHGTGVVEYDTESAFNSLYGLKIATRAATPTIGDNAAAFRYIPYPETGLLVTRLRLCYPKAAPDFQLLLEYDLAATTEKYKAQIQLDTAALTLKYLGSDGALHAVAGANAYCYPSAWYELELQLDLKAMKYLAVAYSGLRADLSAQPLQDVGAGDYRHCKLTVTITAVQAAQTYAYLDNIYVGQYPEA